jgi:cytochrome P450
MALSSIVPSPLASADAPLYPPTVTPPPEPLPLWKFLPRFVRNPLLSLPQQVYEEGIVTFRGRRGPFVWVSDPGLVREVLVERHEQFNKTPVEKQVFRQALGGGILTSDGPAWRWQRRTAAPLFRHAEIQRYLPAMVGAAEERLEAWRAATQGAIHAIDRQMSETTFAIIARTMLGGDVAEAAEIHEAGLEFLERISWNIALAILRVPGWAWHPGKASTARGARRLRTAVSGIVARRRASGSHHDDLLDHLIAARDPETGAPMSDEQMVDNLLTFLAAGHETTAKALTWTLYLLARAPEWQERVRAEAAAVAGAGRIEAGHIAGLAVTERVLKEAMRLYPPAPIIARVPIEDITLGGWRIGRGTQLVIPVFAIHRHRRHWQDPNRFDPDRFLPEREKAIPRTQYMPFGAGPRVCIGGTFAMLEATALLATFVRAAEFVWDGRHLPEPVSRVTLRPKGGMPLGVRMRG